MWESFIGRRCSWWLRLLEQSLRRLDIRLLLTCFRNPSIINNNKLAFYTIYQKEKSKTDAKHERVSGDFFTIRGGITRAFGRGLRAHNASTPLGTPEPDDAIVQTSHRYWGGSVADDGDSDCSPFHKHWCRSWLRGTLSGFRPKWRQIVNEYPIIKN